MQGLVEGKWLNRLLGVREWRPATLGNNLLAKGPGIATTIGAIEAEAAGAGEVCVSYHWPKAEREETRMQMSFLSDLLRSARAKHPGPREGRSAVSP